tara:strand:- start:2724 stop:2993 length:270 start_codon:yes stop_codon:yes gene_type:complete
LIFVNIYFSNLIHTFQEYARNLFFILGEILYTGGENFERIYIFRQELKTAPERRKAIHKEVKPPSYLGEGKLTRAKQERENTLRHTAKI